MKVILNKDFATLGEGGDVVEVKAGYARNFLLPQKIAVLNTKENQSYFKARAGAIQKRKEEKRLAARSLKEKLDSYEMKIVMPTGENGRLFGGVTAVMIQDMFAKDGIEVERKKIEVPSHTIKTVGTYSFNVTIYGGESASVKLIIEAEEKKEAVKGKGKSKPRAEKKEVESNDKNEDVKAEDAASEVKEESAASAE